MDDLLQLPFWVAAPAPDVDRDRLLVALDVAQLEVYRLEHVVARLQESLRVAAVQCSECGRSIEEVDHGLPG